MSNISNNNSINNQSNNSSSLSSSSSSSRRSQPVTLRSFMTRSTIYNRNEARRAKTLALKDDDRPALVRILANMGGTEAAAASLAAHQARSAARINHNNNTNHNNTNNNESHSFHAPAHVSFDDTMDEDTTTTWTAYQAPSAVSQQTHKNASAAATTATIAAAVGAATSEVGRQLLLKRAAPAHSHAAPGFSQLPLSSLYSPVQALPQQALPQQQPVNRVVVLPFVKEEGGSLALFLAAQQQTTVPSSNTATTMRNHSNTAGPLAPQQQMQASSRAAFMTSRVVPTVMLFGIKAWLEQSIDQHTTTTTTTPTTHKHHAGGGISVASLIGSAGAGAVVATSRLIFPVGHGIVATVGRHTVGSEATAAVAYFSSYELFKSWFAGSSSDYRREKSESNNNVLAIASAGALAGSLYEMIRSVGSTAAAAVQQQQQSVSVLRRSPFAASGNLRGLVLRAAPAHALLFLGYEATLQLLSQSE